METVTASNISKEAIEQYIKDKGLDIEAVKYPIPNLHNSYKDSNGDLVVPARDLDTGFYSINDAKDGRIFNPGVKKNYKILQYAETFATLQDVAKVTDFKFVDGGLWNHGAEAYIQFDLPETIQVGNNGDHIAKRLTAISSHSSKYSFIILITPNRVWCENALPAMFSRVKKEQSEGLKTMFKIKHTTNGRIEIDNVGKWLETVNGQFKMAEEKYNRLAEIKITDRKMVEEVFTRLFKVQADSKRSKTIVQGQVENALARFMDADGGKVERDTAWNLANALQGSFQHAPARKPETHQKSVLVGSIASKGRDAFATVMEICSNVATDPSKYKIDSDIEGMLKDLTL
jgi:hypothetical protein